VQVVADIGQRLRLAVFLQVAFIDPRKPVLLRSGMALIGFGNRALDLLRGVKLVLAQRDFVILSSE
jgi:hypothetical protein